MVSHVSDGNLNEVSENFTIGLYNFKRFEYFPHKSMEFSHPRKKPGTEVCFTTNALSKYDFVFGK